MKIKIITVVVVLIVLSMLGSCTRYSKNDHAISVQKEPFVLNSSVKVETFGPGPVAFSGARLFHGGPSYHELRFRDDNWQTIGKISVFDASKTGYKSSLPLSVDKLHIELRVTGRVGSMVTISQNNQRIDVVIEFVTRKTAEQWKGKLSESLGKYLSLNFAQIPSRGKLPLGIKNKDVELSAFP